MPKKRKTTKSSSKKNNNLADKLHSFSFSGKYLAVTLVFALTAAAVLAPTFAAKGGNKGAPGGGGSTAPSQGLYLEANTSRLSNGNTITFRVLAESGNNLVNAVEAELNYPTDKLQYVSTSTANSDFSITAEETAASGLVKIVRGQNPPVGGKLNVAEVTFKAISSGGRATVNLNGSRLMSSQTNKDIVQSNGSYEIRLSK